MRIAIIVTQYPPNYIGGTELQAQHIAEQLSDRGHDVQVITQYDEETSTIEKIGNKLKIHRLKKQSFPFAKTFFLMIYNTLRIASRIRYDIFLAFTLYPSGLAAILAGKLYQKPVVVWGRGNDVYVKVNYIVQTIRLFVLMSADIIVAQTNNMKKRFLEIWPHIKSLKIVPNALNLKTFKMKKIRKFSSSPSLTYVGGLRPVKGLEHLIEAFRQVLQEMPDVKLYLVGEGEDKGRLLRLAKKLDVNEKIIWVGQVNHEKVVEYLHLSWVFVLPSLSEGLPNVLLEAMACGVPCVATAVGGVPDIIENNVNGLLVKPEDPQLLGQAIITLLKDEKLRQRISENNRKDVRKYDSIRVTKMVESILKKEAESV